MTTELVFWSIACFAVLLTGISKSGFGGAGGGLAVALLALVMPVQQAAALMLPILIAMDAKTVHYYYRYLQRGELKGLLPAALVGIVIGSATLGLVPDVLLYWLLGILCLLFALWQNIAHRLGQGFTSAGLWGMLSGFTSTLIHAGGPPLNIYLLTRQLAKHHWLATAGIFFAVINVTKIIPYTLLGQWQKTLLLQAVLLLPIAWIGVWLGHQLQKCISQNTFLFMCRWLLLASGLLLIAKGF